MTELRYIPVAEYDIGLCHYGATEPYKTVTVKADSLQVAMAEGRKLLKPTTVEQVRHVATRPNPEHVATTRVQRRKADLSVGLMGPLVKKEVGMVVARKGLDELIAAVENAAFDCGNWNRNDADEPYSALQLRLDNAKQALLNYLAPVVGN